MRWNFSTLFPALEAVWKTPNFDLSCKVSLRTASHYVPSDSNVPVLHNSITIDMLISSNQDRNSRATNSSPTIPPMAALKSADFGAIFLVVDVRVELELVV